MLRPIAQALNAVIEPTTQVWFAMQGGRVLQRNAVASLELAWPANPAALFTATCVNIDTAAL
jgi:hypothetical protein